MSPSPNSSHSGWSPSLMPRQAASACPLEDVLASWAPTPGSDHRLIGHPSRSFVPSAIIRSSASSLPLTRAPHILAPCSRTHTPAPFLNGTARGNQCVSRSWERRLLPHPDTVARARSHNGSAGRTSIGVWCRDRPAPARETKTERHEEALTALSRYSHRLARGRTTDVSLLDTRGPDRCSAARVTPTGFRSEQFMSGNCLEARNTVATTSARRWRYHRTRQGLTAPAPPPARPRNPEDRPGRGQELPMTRGARPHARATPVPRAGLRPP